MKPALTFLVHSRNGDATALAEVGCRRATELGLHAKILPLTGEPTTGIMRGSESVTALVPIKFAVAEHEAWCLLCQLSLLRCSVGFTILVLGAAGSAGFQARQRALLSAVTLAPRRIRRAVIDCA